MSVKLFYDQCYLVGGLTSMLLTLCHCAGLLHADIAIAVIPILCCAAIPVFLETIMYMVDVVITLARWVDRREARRRHVPLTKLPPKKWRRRS